MPVVGAAADQLGQRELIENAGLDVRQELGLHDGLHELGRNHQPSQPQAGREALARGAGVDDVLGCERLHRPDGLAVVAELAVVVVLDDQAVGVDRPFDRAPAPLRRERDAKRELVRRREQDGTGAPEPIDDRARPVDRKRREAHAGRSGDVAVQQVAVGLDRERVHAALALHAAEQRKRLHEAGADDDPVGRDADAADAREVSGQGFAQLGAAARVAVAECVIGRRGEGTAGGGEPGRTREQGQVGPPRAQVVTHARGGRGRLRGRRRRGGVAGNARARALPRRKPPLRDQLAVGIGDGVSGDAEVERQGA